MTISDKEFASHMGDVAKALLSNKNESLSSRHEWRYGNHGSLSVDVASGRWYDHEAEEGGGVLDLIKREVPGINGNGLEWMRNTLGLDIGDEAPAPSKHVSETYDYCDENGELLFQVVRFDNPKTFRQRRPDPNGGWVWSTKGVRRVLYHQAKLLEANERTVFIAEGEKDVHTLEKLGLVATTNPGGAGKWRDEYRDHFRGSDVVILPDNDEAGEEHAIQVAASLQSVASRVRVVHLPGLATKGDVTDWIRAGGTFEKLSQVCDDPAYQAAPGQTPQTVEPDPGPLVLSSADFVRGFTPPSYLLDGVLQRGFLYSFTGATGSGKTAIALRLLASTALGRSIGTREIERGRCLMLVGENPDDVRARWIALSEHMGFDADAIDVHFIPGIFEIARLPETLHVKAEQLGGFSLVVVDTGAAYFPGEDENSNKELGDYARVLRTLTKLPGNPTVVTNCHPTKNAGAESLIPRGGGAFIAEMDGNLCCSKSDLTAELHWQGKFRGPDFDPMPFALTVVTTPRLVDTRGREMPTVIARVLSDTEQAQHEDASVRDLHKLLAVMSAKPNASMSELATAAGWTGSGGTPHKSKVHRLLSTLKKQRLVDKELNTWVLTSGGQKAAARVGTK